VTEGRAAQLRAPAARAAARVALTLLDAAHAAEQRVRERTDDEALHDFRVALRRMRSTLRGFRAHLDAAIPKKVRTGLRDLARATTAGRDAEVLAIWARDLETQVPPAKRTGLPWLHARLAERRDRAFEELRRDVVPEFGAHERRLRKALAIAAKRARDGPSYGTVLATLVSEHAAVLEQELAALRSAADDVPAHSARITAKRLRYLLEPVVELEPRAGPVVARVKALQTLLGELRDLQLAGAELADAAAAAAAERARDQHQRALAPDPPPGRARDHGPRPATAGLLALARVVTTARDERFRRVLAEGRGAPLADLLKQCAAIATALEAGARPPRPPRPAPPPRLPEARPQRTRSRRRRAAPRRA